MSGTTSTTLLGGQTSDETTASPLLSAAIAGDQRAESVAKHTPGPWMDEVLAREGKRFIYGGSGGYSIGYVFDGRPDDEGRANARLIAAAPDMLAALQFYADEKNYDDNGAPFRVGQEHGQEYEELDVGKKARAAISRALGSQT